MEMNLTDSDREEWVSSLLAQLDLPLLLSNTQRPAIAGATGPRGLPLQDGEEYSRPAPVQYVFDRYDVRLDIATGALIFHLPKTTSDAHARIERIFRKMADQEHLYLESLWFSGTMSSQISLIDVSKVG